MEVHKKHEIHVFDIKLNADELEALQERKTISESYLIENKIYQFRMKISPAHVISITEEDENEI